MSAETGRRKSIYFKVKEIKTFIRKHYFLPSIHMSPPPDYEDRRTHDTRFVLIRMNNFDAVKG